jgi:NADH-quinone oxidoreductase subunit G
VQIALPAASSGLQRIADVPVNFTDGMARRSPALQQTADSKAPVARINDATLTQLGLACGNQVRVSQGAAQAIFVAKSDNTTPVGCVRLAAAHASTVMLGDMFGSISVERA